MAGNDQISIYHGEDIQLDFTMNPVVDISGWTLSLNVEGNPESPKLITKAGTVTDGPNGEFSVTLTDADTGAVAVGRYRYDVWRTDAGNERVIADGELVMKDSARFPV